MEFEKEVSCCFTGHRPGKIKSPETEIRNALREEIDEAINEGYSIFISGMAPGVDTWVALEIIKAKENNPDIKLVCAVPFKGVENNRTDEEKAAYKYITDNADCIEYICPQRARWSFNARDRWMVDNAKRVIAVFNGTSGGTKFTLEYAQKKNRDIHVIHDGNL